MEHNFQIANKVCWCALSVYFELRNNNNFKYYAVMLFKHTEQAWEICSISRDARIPGISSKLPLELDVIIGFIIERTRARQLRAPFTATLKLILSTQYMFNSCSFNYKSDYKMFLCYKIAKKFPSKKQLQNVPGMKSKMHHFSYYGIMALNNEHNKNNKIMISWLNLDWANFNLYSPRSRSCCLHHLIDVRNCLWEKTFKMLEIERRSMLN